LKRLPKTRSGKILRGTMQKIADSEGLEASRRPIDDPAILDEITAALKPLGYAQRDARARRLMKLEGKVAVVTGRGAGIGAACAAALIGEGANVVLSGTSTRPRAATAKGLGARASFVACERRRFEAGRRAGRRRGGRARPRRRDGVECRDNPRRRLPSNSPRPTGTRRQSASTSRACFLTGRPRRGEMVKQGKPPRAATRSST
jgi:hypothetical protein